MRPYRLIFHFFKCYLDRVQYRGYCTKKNTFIYKHTKTGFPRRYRVKSRLSNENFDFILRLV